MLRGYVVVFGGQRQIGAVHGAPSQAQAVEGLRAGDLVHEVHVDIEQVGLVRRAVYDMTVPELLRERLTHFLAIP